MANVISGTFTLSQMLENTWNTKFKNRFEFQERDVLKKVVVIKQTVLHPDRPNEPTITLMCKSFSYPNYSPYNNHVKNGGKQRKTKHQYDQIFSIETDSNGQFSMESTNWKYRLGSQKKWQDNVPQNKVKTIYRKTLSKWKKDYEKECEQIKKKYTGEIKKKKLIEAKKKYNKRKTDHRKSAPYLDKGDFNSRVNGINGDAHFRLHPALKMFGHLYGREPENLTPNPKNIFCPKHMLALIDFLIKRGILI